MSCSRVPIALMRLKLKHFIENCFQRNYCTSEHLSDASIISPYIKMWNSMEWWASSQKGPIVVDLAFLSIFLQFTRVVAMNHIYLHLKYMVLILPKISKQSQRQLNRWRKWVIKCDEQYAGSANLALVGLQAVGFKISMPLSKLKGS